MVDLLDLRARKNKTAGSSSGGSGTKKPPEFGGRALDSGEEKPIKNHARRQNGSGRRYNNNYAWFAVVSWSYLSLLK